MEQMAPNRDVTVGVRLRRHERTMLETAASLSGLYLSQFLRKRALEAASRDLRQQSASSDPDAALREAVERTLRELLKESERTTEGAAAWPSKT